MELPVLAGLSLRRACPYSGQLGAAQTRVQRAAVLPRFAGRALKKSVLELGGSDPFIVMPEADLPAAAAMAARSRFQNDGQSCIAAKRFIVVQEVADEFERRFAKGVSALKVGDPLKSETQIGPMARDDLRDALDEQVRLSVQQGARALVGGERISGRGYFYAPTVLTNLSLQMPVCTEETFGPVAAVIRVKDADEAIKVASAYVSS